MNTKHLATAILGELDCEIGHGTTVDSRKLLDLNSLDRAELIIQIEQGVERAGFVLSGDLQDLFHASDKQQSVTTFVRSLVDNYCTDAIVQEETSPSKSGLFRFLIDKVLQK